MHGLGYVPLFCLAKGGTLRQLGYQHIQQCFGVSANSFRCSSSTTFGTLYIFGNYSPYHWMCIHAILVCALLVEIMNFGYVLWNQTQKTKRLNPLLYLGGGFKYFLFSPLFGEDSQFDYIVFFNHKLDIHLQLWSSEVSWNIYFSRY